MKIYKIHARDSVIYGHDKNDNFYEFNQDKQMFELVMTKEKSDEIDKMVEEIDMENKS